MKEGLSFEVQTYTLRSSSHWTKLDSTRFQREIEKERQGEGEWRDGEIDRYVDRQRMMERKR